MKQNKLISQTRNQIESLVGWVQNRKWIRYSINVILLSIVLFSVFTYIKEDWQLIQSYRINLNFRSILIAFLIFGINFFLLVIAWHILISKFAPLISLKQNTQQFSYSYLYKFLPTPAPFLASRMYLYNQLGIKKSVILSTTALETILHMVTGFIVFLLLLLDKYNPVSWLIILLSIPVILIIQKPDLLEMKWLHGEKPIHPISKIDIITLLVIFSLTWILSGPFFIHLMKIITNYVPITIDEALKIWIIGSLVAYLGSYTLGGAGFLREFSLTLLLSQYFHPPMALLITLTVRVFMTFGGLVWALLFLGLITISGTLNSRRDSTHT